MDEKRIREIVEEEINKRINLLNKAAEGIVRVKTPLELKIEKDREEKEWIQAQM